MRLIARLQSLWRKLDAAVKKSAALRALCYALMAAAIYAVWLLTDGESVAFVYSEF